MTVVPLFLQLWTNSLISWGTVITMIQEAPKKWLRSSSISYLRNYNQSLWIKLISERLRNHGSNAEETFFKQEKNEENASFDYLVKGLFRVCWSRESKLWIRIISLIDQVWKTEWSIHQKYWLKSEKLTLGISGFLDHVSFRAPFSQHKNSTVIWWSALGWSLNSIFLRWKKVSREKVKTNADWTFEQQLKPDNFAPSRVAVCFIGRKSISWSNYF